MDRLLYTMKIFDDYERRFAEAAVKRRGKTMPPRNSREVRDDAMRMLGIREEMIPKIGDFTQVSTTRFPTYDVLSVRYETFPHCYGAADIYTPHGEGPFPVVFLFAGHGVAGRKTPSYRVLCHRMAASGAIVVSPDGIGQGDRTPIGHRFAFSVLATGLTVQGLMVLEALALIRRFTTYPQADHTRFAACGNSGGGTLCLFLAALSSELAALASTGYPSDFAYILSKERRHCACNLLPSCAGSPEMWELLAAFAPRPLLIEQGEGDHLIPLDYFLRTTRKVAYTYRAAGAADAFSSATTKEGHSWTEADIAVIVDFLCRSLCLSLADDPKAPDFDGAIELPADCVDIFSVASALTGCSVDPNAPLASVFPPSYHGIAVDPQEIVPDIGRGDVMQIWAQMECALKEV